MSMGGNQILGSLSVPIRVDASNVSASFGLIRGQLGGLSSAITRVTRGLMFPTLAGAGALALGLKQAADLEMQFTTLAKTTGLGGAEMAKFQGEIKKLAVELAGVKLEDILSISAIGGRMGIQGAALSKFTRDISMVRIVLSDIPAEEATNGIARILNVFELGTENAIRFASALNQLDMASTATGRDILDISTRIAPAASILGMTPQKVMALSAALKDAGARNEVAGTAMSQILGKMAQKTSEFARVAGVSTKTFSDALRRDPLEALKLLTASIERMDELAAFGALTKLGLDGQRTTMTLLQLGKVMGKVDDFVATANDEWNSTASILNQVKINSQATYAQLTRLGNAMRLAAAEAGKGLLPVVKALADSFGELAIRMEGTFSRNAGQVEAFAAGFLRFTDTVSVGTAAISARLAEFPKHLDDAFGPGSWKGLIDGVKLAGFAFRNLPAIFDLAALMIAEKVVNIGEYFGTIPANLGLIADYIGGNWYDLIRDALAAVSSLFENFGKNLASLGSSLVGFLKNPAGGFDFEWTPLLKGFEATAAQLPEMIRPHLTSMQAEIDAKLAEIAEAEGRRPTKPGAAQPRPEASILMRPFGKLAPGSLGPDDPFMGAAAAMGRMALSPRERERRIRAARAAKLAKRREAVLARGAAKKAGVAAQAGMSPAERKRAAKAAALRADATSQRARRAGVAAKGGTVDILKGIDSTLNSLLGVNKSTDDQIKKGIPARLS